ncbi:MAG: FGGY family carbohydrate kinase [Clostridia bacterium]|nr:FGGY family carbohydrate kinase [Clostridia bacterium]
MEELLIGIDVGTTGTKSMVLDASGTILASAYKSYPTYNDRPGYAEQDAEDWWGAVVETVRECTKDKRVADAVVAIGLSSQGGSMVPIGADGRPIRRSMIWMDKRGDAQSRYFSENMPEDYIYLTTGWALSGSLNAVQIRWMSEHEPELFAKTAFFLSTIDFVNMKLTGRRCIDPSNAGITQLFNLHTMKWDEKILGLVGLGAEKLPEIADSGSVIGELTGEAAEALGLKRAVRVVSGGHDQYCVALGAGAVNAGDVLLATGTAWVVAKISDSPQFDTATHLAQSIHTVKGKWGSIGSLENGGSSLKWFQEKFAGNIEAGGKMEKESLQQIDAIAAERPIGSNGILFYPCFGGAMLPKMEPLTRGTILGLDFSHDRYDLARAVMEGVVFQTRRILELFGREDRPNGVIKMLGGATRSPLWSQMVADIFGAPITIPLVVDIACVGAAALAGCGAGLYPDACAGYARLRQKETEFVPVAANVKRYQALYEQFAQRAGLLEACYKIGSNQAEG